MGTQTNLIHSHLFMTESLQYVCVQLDQLEGFGFPRTRALALLGLSEEAFNNPKARIEADRVEHMYREAASALSDPQIGIRVGYKFRVHDFGKTGSIYSHCNNLSEVLRLNSRYQCLTVDVGKPEYRVEDGRHFFLYNRYEDAKHMHHVMGAVFGAWATALRWLSWAAGHELKEAHLMPRAPDDISFYEEVVQCPIIFGMPRNHVEFHPESMSKPLITRNPEKLAQSKAILDKLLNLGDEAKNFETAVQASIQAALAEGSVNLPIVAKRMNMPDRQFRNKMTNLNLSFRDMLESERKQLFRQLHATNQSFASIAYALGYNDQAAFNRAFKRWYNTSPSKYVERRSKHL